MFAQQRKKAHVDVGPLRDLLNKKTKRFIPRRQEDAHEFLRALLEQIQTECRSTSLEKTTPDPVSATFRWEAEIAFTCKECGQETKVPEILMDISLAVDAGNTIKSLLDHYFKEELVDRKCGKCAAEQSTCRRTIKKLPDLLVIQLQRFRVMAGETSVRKRMDAVQLQSSVKLGPFLGKNDLQEDIENREEKEKDGRGVEGMYKIRSIVSHFGDQLSAGHYVCDVYDRAKPEKHRWITFDDDRVIERENYPERSRSCYLIMYERV
ncbi:hypothetical protein HK097_010336 [Rhizophlyctis rosea]|uniref:USP domain-containing protein n=1 Tax=Rhizophlyctis rosea TaxID=64517 RepID=A0AAD5X3Z6_9FUNG|nr:hypothetical protein HK097_010336 [Rhizophlyctis rosea]